MINIESIQAQIIQFAENDENIELMWLYGSQAQAQGTAHEKAISITCN
jgi:hypothetical protein